MSFSVGEKLIIMMLVDISSKINADHEIDSEFIKKAIARGHEWAIFWRYEYLDFEDAFPEPPEVAETANILTMWQHIEIQYGKMSDEDKEKIKIEAAPFGNDVRFDGFDGNNEKHYGIAMFMVNELGRFQSFKGRDLNSHAMVIDSYRMMYNAYDSIRKSKGLRFEVISVDEMIAILKAEAFE